MADRAVELVEGLVEPGDQLRSFPGQATGAVEDEARGAQAFDHLLVESDGGGLASLVPLEAQPLLGGQAPLGVVADHGGEAAEPVGAVGPQRRERDRGPEAGPVPAEAPPLLLVV